jgi:enoyl-CoA hydratase/carnithine racemase
VVAPEELLEECRRVATDIVSCVPETVKVYKQMVNDGLQTDLAAGLAMERNVMTHVNQRVSGDAIASRRSGVQTRGKTQQTS